MGEFDHIVVGTKSVFIFVQIFYSVFFESFFKSGLWMGAASAYALRDSVLASRRGRVGRRRRAVPTLVITWRASRLGAAAPLVSIGRGAAPPGPLTSGDNVPVSRKMEILASGVNQRPR